MLDRPDNLDKAPEGLRSGPVSTEDVRGRRRHSDPLVWDHGPEPKGWKLFLMRMAGVDTSLARMVPLDEQQQIWRVGAAVLFGSAMQVICFSISMQLAFGVDTPARLACVAATFVICGVLYLIDAKFVAADWKAHGMALARARGLIEVGTIWERCQRPIAAIVRWTCSVFIASTLATFVLLQVFKPDIERQWRFDYQRLNAALFKDVAEQHSALVRLAEAKLGETRSMKDGLTKERSALVEASPNTADVDAQIAQAIARVSVLRKARDAARARLGERESDAAAERFGVTEKPKHSGQAGSGKLYQHHIENARLLRESIAALSNDLDALESEIARLRQFREKVSSDARQATEKRLAALDTRIAEALERFQGELRQRDDLVSKRAEWIEREVRQSAKYVPMPQGLIDQLKALWVLAAGSTDIFWLVVGTKVLIMLLESAGPLTKFFFTTPGIYGLYASMRVHDALEVEAAWRRPGGDDDIGMLGGDRAPPGHAARRSPFGEKLGAEKPQAAE